MGAGAPVIQDTPVTESETKYSLIRTVTKISSPCPTSHYDYKQQASFFFLAGKKAGANLQGLVKKEVVRWMKGLKSLQLCCVPQHWVIHPENKPPHLPFTRPPADMLSGTFRVPTSICCLKKLSTVGSVQVHLATTALVVRCSASLINRTSRGCSDTRSGFSICCDC